ncbi:MAG: hypothetical protein GX029_02845 [Pseudomonadaceae bacterium]|nr:hypothetical protein [Pseudomonadaceae bacterium]
MKNKILITSLLSCLLIIQGCDNQVHLDLEQQKKLNAVLVDENKTVVNKNSDLSAEIDKLEKQVIALEKENKTLSNTAERQLTKIKEHIDKEDDVLAKAALGTLEKTFPLSAELKFGTELLAELTSILESRKQEEERKKRLGFKILKETKNVNLETVSIAAQPPKIVNRWTFDSYDDSYHYRDAGRGKKFVTVRLSVTAPSAEEIDPNLPFFGLYTVEKGSLKLLSSMKYEFVRWSDYGSYLGNYFDPINSFSHRKTIPLTIGEEVTEEQLKAPLYLVGTSEQCVKRSVGHGRPNVAYRGFYCNPKQTLTLDQVSSNEYFVLKIWNEKKL